jgi:GntR family transcriptional regulator
MAADEGLWNLSMLAIDRSSPLPLYSQVKRAIADRIESGGFAPGDRLPSEQELAARFAVSRATVRQALAELELESVLRRDKGRGTFVTGRPEVSGFLQSSLGFFDDAIRAGHTVASRVLKAEVQALPDWAAEALDLPRGTPGVSIERVRSIDGSPVMYVHNHLLHEFAPSLLAADLGATSLYSVLREHHGITVAGGRRVLEAVTASDRIAELLTVEPGAPLLFVESVSWNGERRPFECYRGWHRSDRSRIEVRVAPA